MHFYSILPIFTFSDSPPFFLPTDFYINFSNSKTDNIVGLSNICYTPINKFPQNSLWLSLIHILTPVNIVESGPVAGVFGASILGKIIGEPNIIAFDVGGTTAKCSLIDQGAVKVTTSYYIEKDERHAGYPIMAPVVDIVEIGNGGGSIAWIDEGGSLKVGPKSAGALPGPVAYGKNGTEPTTCLLYTSLFCIPAFLNIFICGIF